MSTFILIVIGLMCLYARSTRVIGVIGLTLMSLLHPLSFIALLAIGSVAFYIYHYRRKYYDKFSKLPFRRR